MILFFYREEMKQLLSVMMTSCILYSLLSLFSLFYVSYDDVLRIGDALCLLFLCVLSCYVQTKWVLDHFEFKQKSLDCSFYNLPMPFMENPYLSPTNNGYKQSINTAESVPTLSPAFTININPTNNMEMEQITESVVVEPVDHDQTDNKYDDIQNDTKQPESPQNAAISIDDEYDTAMYRILFHSLQSDKLFDSFTKHLSSELSMECSFAFIEFTQFRCLLERDLTFMQCVTAQNVNISSPTKESYSYNLVKLPRSISRSSIVHNKKYARMQPKYRYRKIAKKLCEKYLDSGSEFELFINHQTKQEVIKWVAVHCRHLKGPPRGHGDYSSHHSSQISSNYSSQSEHSSNPSSNGSKSSLSDQLYHLFQQCHKEIYLLMAHSCDRFVKMEEYKKNNNVQ